MPKNKILMLTIPNQQSSADKEVLKKLGSD